MISQSRTRRCAPGVVALALASSLTACGGSPPTSAEGRTPSFGPAQRTSYPLTLDNCGQKLTFSQPPRRVLILNGASVGEVESLLALGLGKSVIANAQSYGVSDDPSMVAAIKALPTGGLSTNGNFDVPAEQVLAAKPDLVISTWSGGFDAKKGFATRERLAAAGIQTLVNPANCALGKPEATPEEKRALKNQSTNSSLEFIALLGRVFDVQQRAVELIGRIRARIDAVRTRVAGRPPKKVLIVYPGMAAMNANGLPAVMTGGIYDDIVTAAGGVNAFAGRGEETTRTLTKEQLATAQVDVLVVGRYTPAERPEAEATKLFAQFPHWNAAKTRTFTVVSDSVYLGPLNAVAVERLAQVMHR
ncbi:iron complex transport system substrate-binding protein [Thermomonospora echinospora]|uniref:Iron complex transport system substrate-binding protein n=1 Tax=Thermomonospora echinospora TaxID=1992 RepID=A0A1H6AI19_9ACTN|nr:ABC transporter substrate-binding protein [Thermomonospora echinospora]SEG47727.1 iron complex transport system substrate-binding protein [Thermomonospora echinospora]